MPVIPPTGGRVVYFYPHRPTGQQKPAQPYAAMIAFVWAAPTAGMQLVNIGYLDFNGQHHAATSVPLRQEGDPEPAAGFYCEWMPYQIEKAKTEAASA